MSKKISGDKGLYFGILVYFVQTTELLSVDIELQAAQNNHEAQNIHKNLQMLLNIDISQISYDACIFVGLDRKEKGLLKILFFISLFLSWLLVYNLFSQNLSTKLLNSQVILATTEL